MGTVSPVPALDDDCTRDPPPGPASLFTGSFGRRSACVVTKPRRSVSSSSSLAAHDRIGQNRRAMVVTISQARLAKEELSDV